MEEVKAIIRQCDVVLICFNMAGQKSLQSAIRMWLPRVTEIDKEIPIIMVGCKEDQAVITEAQIAVRTVQNQEHHTGSDKLIRW
jgi:GTPase SAR1 family protein